MIGYWSMNFELEFCWVSLWLISQKPARNHKFINRFESWTTWFVERDISCFIRVICTWDWKSHIFYRLAVGPSFAVMPESGGQGGQSSHCPLPPLILFQPGEGILSPPTYWLLLLPSPPIFSPSGITDLGYNIYQLSLFSWNKIINQCQRGKLRWVRNSLKPIASLSKITFTWRNFIFNPFSPPTSYMSAPKQEVDI